MRHDLIVQDLESSKAAMDNLQGTILSSSGSDGLHIEYPQFFVSQFFRFGEDLVGLVGSVCIFFQITLHLLMIFSLMMGLKLLFPFVLVEIPFGLPVFIILYVVIYSCPSDWFSLELEAMLQILVSFNSSYRYARSKMRSS